MIPAPWIMHCSGFTSSQLILQLESSSWDCRDDDLKQISLQEKVKRCVVRSVYLPCRASVSHVALLGLGRALPLALTGIHALKATHRSWKICFIFGGKVNIAIQLI